MEKGRKQGTENGLGAAGAKRKSAKPATGAPVTASGCKQHTLPQHRGCIRKDAVNQGGTTEVLSRFRPCGLLPAEDGSVFLCFRLHEAQKNVLRGAKTIV